jgi:hypothetical protein
MPHLLVIFGAGASYDSVDPLIAPRMRAIAGLDDDAYPASLDQYRPPLARELFADRSNFGRVIDRPPLRAARPLVASLRSSVSRGESVEQALGIAMDAARSDTHADVRLLKQLAAVRFYLQQTLADCGAEWSKLANGITNYVSLLDRIERWRGATNQVSLVTFNYDTMLEEACGDALGWQIVSIDDYIRREDHSYVVVKPHGSVNWARIGGPLPNGTDLGNADALVQEMVDDAAQLMFPGHGAHFVWLPQPQPWCRPEEAPDQPYYAFPALAIPLAEKSDFECPPRHLDVLMERIHAVNRLLIVGWRGAEEHFMQRYNGQVPHHAKVLVVAGSDCDYSPIKEGLGLRAEASMSCDGLSAFLRGDALERFLDE